MSAGVDRLREMYTAAEEEARAEARDDPVAARVAARKLEALADEEGYEHAKQTLDSARSHGRIIVLVERVRAHMGASSPAPEPAPAPAPAPAPVTTPPPAPAPTPTPRAAPAKRRARSKGKDAPPVVPTPADTEENRALVAESRPCRPVIAGTLSGVLRLPWAEGDPWQRSAASAVARIADRARFFVGIVREGKGFTCLEEYHRSRRIFSDLLEAYRAAASHAHATGDQAYRAWCAVRQVSYVMRLESDWQAWLRDKHNEGCTDYRERLDYNFHREDRVPDGAPVVRFDPAGDQVDPAEWSRTVWLLLKPNRPRGSV